MNSIVFPGSALPSLREQLLRESPVEGAAILLAGIAQHENDTRLLVREVITPPADAYEQRTPAGLTLTPRFLADAMKQARVGGWSLILTHSHPGTAFPTFSTIDDACEKQLVPVFIGRVADTPHATMVLGTAGQAARLYHTTNRAENVDFVRSVGQSLLDYVRDSKSEDVSSTFDRNVQAFGQQGQRRLQQLHVGIVGVGGTGSAVAQQLAHLGVRRITLLDHDRVELTNLNRLIGAQRRDIGRTKVDVAQDTIHRVNPDADVTPVDGNVVRSKDARSLLGCDLIFSCTDSHGSRAILNHLSYAYYIPVIDVGIVISAREGTVQDITGRVQLLAPGLPCLVCENLLDAEEVRQDLMTPEERQRDPYIIGERVPQPAVISFNTTVSSLAVSMFLSVTVGIPITPRHQIYRGIPGVVRAVTSVPTERCVVCSTRGVLGRGDAAPPPWRRS